MQTTLLNKEDQLNSNKKRTSKRSSTNSQNLQKTSSCSNYSKALSKRKSVAAAPFN